MYEDPNYWSKRATREGVATLGWSTALNDFYYAIKERRLVKLLKGTPSGSRVLEIGCGVGRIGSFIHERRPDVFLVGADFSDGMLYVSSQSGAYTYLVKSDICALPFPDAYFDLVLAMDVLYHIVRPARKGLAWSELARVAKWEEGILAYSSGHEITSLTIIDKLIKSLLPWRLIDQSLRDRLTIWLTNYCDKS